MKNLTEEEIASILNNPEALFGRHMFLANASVKEPILGRFWYASTFVLTNPNLSEETFNKIFKFAERTGSTEKLVSILATYGIGMPSWCYVLLKLKHKDWLDKGVRNLIYYESKCKDRHTHPDILKYCALKRPPEKTLLWGITRWPPYLF